MLAEERVALHGQNSCRRRCCTQILTKLEHIKNILPKSSNMKFYESTLGSPQTVFTVGQKNKHRKSLDTAALSHKKYASNGHLGNF
jgi:CCR4-NOT transcriptional regulation complex NOT5 subunit